MVTERQLRANAGIELHEVNGQPVRIKALAMARGIEWSEQAREIDKLNIAIAGLSESLGRKTSMLDSEKRRFSKAVALEYTAPNELEQIDGRCDALAGEMRSIVEQITAFNLDRINVITASVRAYDQEMFPSNLVDASTTEQVIAAFMIMRKLNDPLRLMASLNEFAGMKPLQKDGSRTGQNEATASHSKQDHEPILSPIPISTDGSEECISESPSGLVLTHI